MRVAGTLVITYVTLLSGLLAQAKAPPRTLDEVVQLVRQTDSRSIEDVESHLGPELLSHYSFSHTTRSPVGASYEKPRIVLWNETGDLMISFAGDEWMSNGRRLEILEFYRNQNRFRFGQVDFSEDRHVRPDIKEVDPKACFNCHASGRSPFNFRATEAAHPIWDTYPDWPGFYGSSHKSRITQKGGSGALPQSPFITKAFEEFKRNAGRNEARYKALIGLQEKSLTDLAELNSQFGSAILKTNLEKVHQLLKRAENYHTYQKAFEKWAEPDEVFIQALSPTDQKQYRERKATLEKEIDESLSRYYEKKAYLLSKSEFPGEGRKLEVSKGPKLDTGKVANLDSYGVQKEMRVRTLFMMEQMKVPPQLLSISRENHPAAVMQSSVSLQELGRMIIADASQPNVVPKAAAEKSFLNCILKFVKRM